MCFFFFFFFFLCVCLFPNEVMMCCITLFHLQSGCDVYYAILFALLFEYGKRLVYIPQAMYMAVLVYRALTAPLPGSLFFFFVFVFFLWGTSKTVNLLDPKSGFLKFNLIP